MFKKFKEKTTELKDRAKKKVNDATEQSRRFRENMESITGVDKARERFAQSRNPIGSSSSAARLGAFSGAATAPSSLSDTFSKIGASPYETNGNETGRSKAEMSTAAPAQTRNGGEREVQSEVTQGSSSAPADEIISTLEPGFYLPEDEFDPLRHVLQSIADARGDFTTDTLHKEEEQLSTVVEAVSTLLSKQVLDHYGEFVQGMSNITELTNNLEQSFVIVKNGRRNLSSASDNVADALRIAESQTRKKSLISTLNMLVRVQECQGLEAKIKDSLESYSFTKAVNEYVAAQRTLHALDGLSCAESFRQDLRSLLWDLVAKMEGVLFATCGDFQPSAYQPLFDAYQLLGEQVKPLGDKVQECFLRAVESQTERVLRSYSFRKGGVAVAERHEDTAAQDAKIGYKELCQQLSPTQFFPCFQKTLEVLFDLLCSHHTMLRWHEDEKQTMQTGDGHERVQACEAVVAALVRSRRAIADMAGARISALLQASSAPSSGQFKAVLDWARAFIGVAEAFSGTQASALRGHLERAGDRYFESLHGQRLEALSQMFGREMWARLPEAAVQQARTALRAAASRGQGGGGQFFGVAAFGGVAEDGSGFNSWMEKGNPFAEGRAISDDSPLSFNDGEGRSGDKALGAEDPAGEAEEEEENAEVRAAYIDEDEDSDENESIDGGFKRNGRVSRNAATGFSALGGTDGDGKGLSAQHPTLTASSLYLLQSVAEYLRLMRVLTPSMPVIFQGFCSLFERTMVHIFGVFGQHAALERDSDKLTPRLRSILVQAMNGSTLASFTPAVGEGVGAEASSVLSSGNLYGLKERAVALESLACIADELKRLKPGLKQALPHKEEQKLERFFGQTISSVEDLREHVYRHVTGLLLNLSWVAETIGDSDKLSDKLKVGKYAKKEISTDHSKWVDDLSAELTQFGAKLACADVTAEALVMLWDFAIAETASAIVDGFSRVRKCSSEGRAGMILDVQMLHGNIRHMAPQGTKEDFRIVDTYVKAFYTPQEEMKHFCQTHLEFTQTQKVALINQMAGAFGWASSVKSELIAGIGANDLL